MSRSFHPGAVYCNSANLTKFYKRGVPEASGLSLDRLAVEVGELRAHIDFRSMDASTARLNLNPAELFALRDALVSACAWYERTVGPVHLEPGRRGTTSETGDHLSSGKADKP